jgi:FtsZ-binding cell division protein ZapB
VATDPDTVTSAPTFELKRFAWGTPDRLEVSGTFGGLPEVRADASPVLVLKAGESVYRLPAVPDSVDGPPQDGRIWQAEFAWQEAPVAFDLAQLQLGSDLAVELPEPGARKRVGRPRMLEARTTLADDADAPRPETPSEILDGSATAVGSQVELLTAQEEIREVRVALQQTQQELARARDDLQAERERRAGDGERYHEGLAKVRGAAEEAMALEQSAAQQLGSDLLGARETIEALRSELESAATARTEAESAAQAETEALREQVAKLEKDSAEAERLRSELGRTRTRADTAHAVLEKTRGAVEQARNDAERLLRRLTTDRAT